MGPRGSFFKNEFKTVKTHKNVLQKTPLKIGIQVAQIGPNFQFLITFDLPKRFWWDRNMFVVGYWSLCSRSGAPSMCTQTAQTPKFWNFFRKFKKKFKSQKQKWHECAIWVHVWGGRSGMLKPYYWWIFWAKKNFEILRKKNQAKFLKEIGWNFPKKWSLDPIFKKL